MEGLTMQEKEVMVYIRELENHYMKDIVARSEQPVPPYTTVTSIVKNLERKKCVKAQRVGNTHLYTPVIKESEYKRNLISGIVRNYFKNSYKEMISFFTKDREISADGLKEIIDVIEKGKGNQSLIS